MSVSEWKTGTATSARSMRADYLKQIIKYHSVSDTAYASSWDWATDIAPSKNAVYDKIESLDLPIISDTAPTTPTQWMIWYDTTNDVLKTYDGSQWNECWSGTDTSNTKTFYLSSTSDLTTAQSAYDWYLAWKNPIVILSWENYIYESSSSTQFKLKKLRTEAGTSGSITQIRQYYMTFTLSSWTVTEVSSGTYSTITSVLSTTVDYSTPYTPTYNGSPATKKYVDDAVAWAGGIQNDTTWTTSTIEAEWVWTDIEFNALSSFWNKIYNIIE